MIQLCRNESALYLFGINEAGGGYGDRQGETDRWCFVNSVIVVAAAVIVTQLGEVTEVL